MHKTLLPKVKNQSFTLKSITTPIFRVIQDDPGTLGTFGAFISNPVTHPSVEMDLSLKIEVRDQTIWTSTPEL